MEFNIGPLFLFDPDGLGPQSTTRRWLLGLLISSRKEYFRLQIQITIQSLFLMSFPLLFYQNKLLLIVSHLLNPSSINVLYFCFEIILISSTIQSSE